MARLNFDQDLIMIYWLNNGTKRCFELRRDILDACNGAEDDIKCSSVMKIEIWRKVTPEIAIKEFTFVKGD